MVDQGPGLAGAKEGGGENDAEKEKDWTSEYWETASFFSVNKSGAPPKDQFLEHQLLNNQLFKHQLSKTSTV
jgi:hypothetical protein